MAKQNASYNSKRILFVSGREVEYTRNDVIIRALSKLGNVDVLGGKGHGSILGRSIILGIKALWRNFTRHYDVIVVGFYGHLLMLPLGLFTRTPIVFDAFLSTYDTLVEDRQRVSSTSIPGRLAFGLDKTACQLATHVILDTPQQVQYFSEMFRIPDRKLSAVPVGCNEDIFFPQSTKPSPTGETTVLFYGSYLPLHGTDVIVRAVALLQHVPIRFKMIGRGQTFEATVALAQNLELTNIDFLQPISLEELPEHIASADICIGGHFGYSQKAKRVIPGKIYQMLAMAKPVIAASSPANIALFTNGKNALLCTANNPKSLAQAILLLYENARFRDFLGENGYSLYQQLFSTHIITNQLEHIINLSVSQL